MSNQINIFLLILIFQLYCFNQLGSRCQMEGNENIKIQESDNRNLNINSIKMTFDAILNYYIRKNLIHPKYEFELKRIIDYYVGQTESTSQTLLKVKQKYNFNTINEISKNKGDTYLAFYFGGSLYTTWVCTISEGGVGPEDEEFGEFIKDIDDINISEDQKNRIDSLRNAIVVDANLFPPEKEDFYSEIFYKLREQIYHSWLAFIWQEIDGDSTQLAVNIEENGSNRMFSLIDYSWENFSEHVSNQESRIRRKSIFNRKLSLEEIFLRTGYCDLKEDTYYWKYYEREGKYLDMGIFNNSIKIYRGILNSENSTSVDDMKEYNTNDKREDIISTRKFFLTHSNQLINDGWIERLRPINFNDKFTLNK